MRRTFCDNCGEQCVNTTVIVNIAIVSHTKTGENVSHDECKPTELCLKCAGLIKKDIPVLMEVIRREEDNYPRDMEAPVRDMDAPLRVAASPDQIARDRMNHE